MIGTASVRLPIAGKELEVSSWSAPEARGIIVLLHEALGSVTYWKDFPEKLCAATGFTVAAYSRAGHGESDGPVEPRSLAYYQKQVEVVLPAVLDHFQAPSPVLYGHSEGAAIAFIYAALNKTVQAVVAECPILVQEERTVQTINLLESSYENGDLSRRLRRYHRDADGVFHSWMRSNRSSLFTNYPLKQYLEQVSCPVLVMQGSRDEFGTEIQFTALQQSLPQAQHAMFDAGHLLHRELPALVAASVADFISSAVFDQSGQEVQSHQEESQ